jgi:hypothetical protein
MLDSRKGWVVRKVFGVYTFKVSSAMLVCPYRCPGKVGRRAGDKGGAVEGAVPCGMVQYWLVDMPGLVCMTI